MYESKLLLTFNFKQCAFNNPLFAVNIKFLWLNDMRIEMTYSTSSQYITENLARTENTRVTSP